MADRGKFILHRNELNFETFVEEEKSVLLSCCIGKHVREEIPP